MRSAVVLFVSIAAAFVAAQLPAGQQALAPNSPASAPETRKPILVDSLVAAVPKPAAPAAVPAVVAQNTGFETELTKLQTTIEAQKQTVDALSKQLEEGLRAKNRLMVAQKLMVAIISLKKAERVLGDVDAKIEAAKGSIKKFGEQADDITDSIKRSEIEHRKELADLNKKLDDLRGGLGEQQQTLESLISKRERIADTVQRWKEHVATLRDAHEASTQPEGVPKPQAPADPLDVPEPPSTLSALGELGIIASAAPAEHEEDAISAANYDAAVRELAKRTFAELGQGRFAADRSHLRGALEIDA